MRRELIKKVLARRDFGSAVTLCGWVRTRRDSKAGFSFIELNDGSCFSNIQVLAEAALPNYESEISRLFPGAAVKVEGILTESPGAGQEIEIKAGDVKVLGYCNPEEYPLQKQRVSFEKLREIAHLRPRTNTFGSVCRVRNALAAATHDFFQERDFYYLNTPVITANDCEGAGEMFQVSSMDLDCLPRDDKNLIDYSRDFFGRKTSLTVSGQLEAETYACALGNVYTFGPTFRAENSNTRRHLAEFWMIEPEMAFADLDDDAALAEEYIRFLCSHVLEHCAEDIDFFNRRIDTQLIERLSAVASSSFKKITYTEAVEILRNSDENFEYPVEWGLPLQAEHECYLTEKAFKVPVSVLDYPREIKAFYMRLNDDNRTVAAMDVLLPGVGEIIGGSQREERHEVLLERFKEHKLCPDTYWWYCDLRRFGSVPHAGFGLGFERIVQFCTGMSNIRDVIPFPRTPRNAEF